MTTLNAEALKKSIGSGRKATVLTDGVKAIIHKGVNSGFTVGEITKQINGPNKKGDEGFVPYQYIYNYLARQLKKEESK